MTCEHKELRKTTFKTSDGKPLYECLAEKCGVMLTVKPMEMERGRRPIKGFAGDP
jgi:hypothetical protein